MLSIICANFLRLTSTYDVRISQGKFTTPSIRLKASDRLRFVNADRETYTVEAPGLLPGDVMVPPGASVEVAPLYEAGRFTAMIEEVPTSEIEIDFEGRPVDDLALREAPFDVARRRDRQPLLSAPGLEPAYGAFTTFNLTTRGEAARQTALQALYMLQEELSGQAPPVELAPYLTAESWARVRPSAAMAIGLGPSAYDDRRFSARVAGSRPKGLHPFTLGTKVGAKMPAGADLVVRVTSDSHWFNLRVCRLVWSRLRGRIAGETLESGYSPPRGRSPILGGFFDGIGNPSGKDRELAVYGGSNATYLALFRIRFDEARFARLSLAQQEALVGRRRSSGHLKTGGPRSAHRTRAQNDGKSLIVRMPLVFDEGPGNTGLIFASVQSSIDRQFERIMSGFMLAKDSKGAKDGLLGYMRFEKAAYYYLPSSPRGSYPGSLRGY